MEGRGGRRVFYSMIQELFFRIFLTAIPGGMQVFSKTHKSFEKIARISQVYRSIYIHMKVSMDQ